MTLMGEIPNITESVYVRNRVTDIQTYKSRIYTALYRTTDTFLARQNITTITCIVLVVTQSYQQSLTLPRKLLRILHTLHGLQFRSQWGRPIGGTVMVEVR